ncbi:Mitotic checkpoint serine/threonine-protein kinase BUB1 [Chionoecetes opilio]|uniref:Mitotic checkpoint serine/threonine-protein kinase BUB1 n=1 Tax=Chionoecetes opilio TaxID=41210 RepID=A0A8J5BTR3_CHIOP|nr:Mitotic checkpoint serine/threonine-protein kinase BUB1 [Chionoecetes opilio]
MEVTHDDSSQWEQSKENIQPLKQGRKATVLSVVLDDNATQKLNLMRHEFEEELRTYSGNDPLDVWYRYVLWVEQNYPKGGKEGKLPKLIEKCLMAVYSNSDVREKYVNDQRFLDIWIKYANLIHNPLEIYQTMEAKGLCLSFADLYINWAWEMEKAGNYKRADAIYEKGLQQGAQPLCNLQESHKKFQIRVTRGTIEGRIGDQEVSNLEQDRVALGSLKSQGHRIAVNRSGSALSGPAGRCPQDVTSKTEAGLAFSIFKVRIICSKQGFHRQHSAHCRWVWASTAFQASGKVCR